MEDLDVSANQPDEPGDGKEPRGGAKHLGIGVVAVMSLKGTATLTATYLLPSWPLRFLALGIVVSAGTLGIIRHRRNRQLRPADGDQPAATSENRHANREGRTP